MGRSPAGPLMTEHRLIERMVALLETELAAIDARGSVDPRSVDIATDFIRTYADRCHHGKEEDILFRRLADKPLAAELSAAMAGLIEDHVYGRRLTRTLAAANDRYASGDGSALPEISSSIRALVEFYPVHIEKEDRHFFRPCLEYFTLEEREKMVADFEEFDRSLIHARYRDVVERLEAGGR